MAISPVAGVIYANQVAPAASQVQGEQQAKFDIQSALAAVAEQKNTKQEKKKKDEKELNLDEIDEKLAELRQNEEESEKHFFNFSV